MTMDSEREIEIRFFLADSITDTTGKPVLVGFYPDNTLIVPKEMPDPSKETPAALQQLSVLANIQNCASQVKINFQITDPNGEVIYQLEDQDQKVNKSLHSDGYSLNSIFNFTPFWISALGQFKVDLQINETRDSFTFSIVKSI